MATFYRVEKNGKGPYAGNHGDDNLIVYLTNKKTISGSYYPPGYETARPVPSKDRKLSPAWNSLLGVQDSYIFGFAKFDDIFAWFNLPDEIAFFKEYGYKIAIYETDTIIKGSKQAVAKKDELVLVDTRDF